MTAETHITGHLDLWTAAIKRKSSPGRGSSNKVELYGIKKLRELILELAVRGLLVSQDPKDESASELLGRIAVEKARLTNEGKFKDKKLSPVTETERPFALPKGWLWERFGNLAEHNAGKTLDQGKNQGVARPYITTSNVYWGRFDFANVREMRIEEAELEKCLARKNDLLICEGGEAGRAAIWNFDHEICFQNHIHRARFFQGIDPYYVYRLLEKMNYSGEIDAYRKGVGISNMSGKALSSIPVPLPPIAEQHRIVAKVDELMALCDQLEQQTDASLSAHQTLVETLLNTLTSAADHAQFASAWQRIAEHFDTLFITEESIDQLKQTILQLAVMGKLVPQDPNDEPASVLLKKIAAEKAKLSTKARVRRGQALSPVVANERPSQLPQGWEWARLGDCGITSTGKTPSTKEAEYFKGEIPFIGPGQVSPQGDILTPDKFLSQTGLEESTEALSGDILMVCIGGSIGKAAIADKQLAFNQQINAIRPINISSPYLYFALTTERFYASVLKQASGSATPIINRSKWEDLLVPVSPEAEQYRMVEKVGELMTICDRLKLHINDASKIQLHLADAIAEAALSEA